MDLSPFAVFANIFVWYEVLRVAAVFVLENALHEKRLSRLLTSTFEQKLSKVSLNVRG